MPWHRGQSGHPRPEPVIRTIPPRVIRQKTAIEEAIIRASSRLLAGLNCPPASCEVSSGLGRSVVAESDIRIKRS